MEIGAVKGRCEEIETEDPANLQQVQDARHALPALGQTIERTTIHAIVRIVPIA